MPRKPKNQKLAKTMSAMDIRLDVKNNIKHRDNPLTRWKCLEETVASEDRRRREFNERAATSSLSSLPTTIQRFIRTLKQSVRVTMRHVGGTPFSIIRQMFLHWDADHKAALDETDLNRCLLSLGVRTTHEERKEVIKFYSDKADRNMISYQLLLEDIKNGEPSMLEFAPREFDEETIDEKDRFALHKDKFAKRPKTVDDFIEALRVAVNQRLTVEGGTFYSHLRNCFIHYDSDFSGALNADELMRAMRASLNISVSASQAAEIIQYYDRGGTASGEFSYKMLLDDVVQSQPSVIQHVEESGEDRDNMKATIKKNSFLSDQFRAAPSRVLQTFIDNARRSLTAKVALRGGALHSWLREAFVAWDPHMLGIICSHQAMQGAAKRIGIDLTEEEANAIIISYDREGSGEMHYQDLMKDILEDEPGLLADTRNGTLGCDNIYESTMASMSNKPISRPQSAPSVYRKTALFEKDPPRRLDQTGQSHHFVDTRADFGGTAHGKPPSRAGTTTRPLSAVLRKNAGVVDTDAGVSIVLDRVRRAADQFALKSRGRVDPKDIVLGSFLRFDPDMLGRVSAIDTRELLRQLQVKSLVDDDVVTLVRWFDTNGSNMLDYHCMVKELYGDDVIMRRKDAPRPTGPERGINPVVKMQQQQLQRTGNGNGNGNAGSEDVCAMSRPISGYAASTAFDFATKDTFWDTHAQEEMEEARRVQKRIERTRRPNSANATRMSFNGAAGNSFLNMFGNNRPGSAANTRSGIGVNKSTSNFSANPSGGVASSAFKSTAKGPHPNTKAYKQLQRALSFRQMKTEKLKIVQKLEEIERQRKAIQDSYRPKNTKVTYTRDEGGQITGATSGKSDDRDGGANGGDQTPRPLTEEEKRVQSNRIRNQQRQEDNDRRDLEYKELSMERLDLARNKVKENKARATHKAQLNSMSAAAVVE